MNILEQKNAKGDKILFYYDYGRGSGQRPATGIFIYTNLKTAGEKAHNKGAIALLDAKNSEAIIEKQAIGSANIPKHKLKENFLGYYDDYFSSKTNILCIELW